MRRFDAFWELPAVAHHPVKYASFRQTTLASGFAPVAKSNTEDTDLSALGDDLGFGLRSRLVLVVLAVIRLAHVQVNRYAGFNQTQSALDDDPPTSRRH